MIGGALSIVRRYGWWSSVVDVRIRVRHVTDAVYRHQLPVEVTRLGGVVAQREPVRRALIDHVPVAVAVRTLVH